MSFHTGIVGAALANADFRRTLYTTDRSQLVLMSVAAGDDIGLEQHDVDQALVMVAGEGRWEVGGGQGTLTAGDVVVVPAGTHHNIINTGEGPLKLYTFYSPPEHPDGTIHHTRADAMAAEAAEHGQSPTAPPRGLTVGSLFGQPQ